MGESNFVDYVKILFRSGSGGPGSAHLLRTKTTSKGGPDGGDGGRGGHVILKGNKQLWTLLHLKYRKHIFAEDGQAGSNNNKHGADGKDAVIEVPLGTVAVNPDSGEKVLEITSHRESKILMNGGRGGLGNSHFKSSTNQTPRYAQPGEKGDESWLVLELKILADVGLVGFPNAGKSTLLSVLSAAKPKIADYPFTTLVPQLGIVSYYDEKSFVMADIPGIIEGAAEGRGIGHRFLRHIERNPVLLFLIPVDADNIADEFAILISELKKYNPELLDKKRLLAISKVDMLDEELLEELKEEIPDVEYIFISSVTGTGLKTLKDRLWQHLSEF